MIYIMKRTNIYLSASQVRLLAELSQRTGLSCAEIVRRALDELLARSSLSPMMRNKRRHQEAFWAGFGGTWEEQAVFRIPEEKRESWIVTDNSRWDDERWA